MMDNPRIYGSPPYRVAVVHGGPGAAGGMSDVAARISSYAGTVEPLQTRLSVEGEITELHQLITGITDAPVILIGHSWGAWLSLLTAARYPESVSKLILVAGAPFEERYAASIYKTRIKRLNKYQRVEFGLIMDKLSSRDYINKKAVSRMLHDLFLKSDCYKPLESAKSYWEGVGINSEIFSRIWEEAAELRRSGELLKAASSITCPVTAIHGDYDPHPGDGVNEPLEKTLKNFRFLLLKKCGHYPWLEKQASEKFFEILKDEILNFRQT